MNHHKESSGSITIFADRSKGYFESLRYKYERACRKCGCELKANETDYCAECEKNIRDGREMIWPDEQITETYRRAKNQGEILEVLADCNLCTVEAMARYIKRLGFPEPPVKQYGIRTYNAKGSEIADMYARELYDKGMTDSAMSKELGVTLYCISEWRKRNNLQSNYMNPDRGEKQMREMLAAGKTPKEIAIELGFSVGKVRHFRRDMQKAAEKAKKKEG